MLFKNNKINLSVHLKKEQKNEVRSFASSTNQFSYLKTKHSWHLVDPSPWPFVAGVGALFFTTGNVLYMHKYIGGGHMLILGLITILYVMFIFSYGLLIY